MPFDRLIRWADAWAERSGRSDVIAQIGPSQLTPAHLRFQPLLEPDEFRRHVREADALIAHAGMGSIITALELGKPILVVPRLGRLGETRNDHQVATAQRFEGEGLVLAAYEEADFDAQAEALLTRPPAARIGARASDSLLARVREVALDGS